MATEPATRAALLRTEPLPARATRIGVVIDDLIDLILGPQFTTGAPMARLSTRLAALTLPPRKLLRLLACFCPPLLTRFGGILRRRL